MYKFLWTLVMLASIVIGLVWFFGWDKVKNWTFDQSEVLGVQELIDDPNNITANLKDKVEEYQMDALEKFDELKESFNEEIKKKKVLLTESINNSLNSATGVTTSVSVIMVAKTNQPYTFLLRNTSDEDTKYEIEWGDGKGSEGLLISQEEELISHTWNAIGDYLVVLGVDKVLVRVIK